MSLGSRLRGHGGVGDRASPGPRLRARGGPPRAVSAVHRELATREGSSSYTRRGLFAFHHTRQHRTQSGTVWWHRSARRVFSSRLSSCSSSGRRGCGTSSSSWTGTCLGSHRCQGHRQLGRPPLQPPGLGLARGWPPWGTWWGVEGHGLHKGPLPPPPMSGSQALLKAHQGTGQGESA